MEEIWKDIPSYEGLYQASNLGRVKSLARWRRNGNGGYITKEKILSNKCDSSGYYLMNLYKDGKMKNYRMHQLVAMAFLGHNPNGFNLLVDHIDNDKLNNRVDNLQITTNRHNSSKNRKNESGYTGVFWCNLFKKWRSRIHFNGKRINLGFFENKIEAHNAYQSKLKELNDKH